MSTSLSCLTGLRAFAPAGALLFSLAGSAASAQPTAQAAVAATASPELPKTPDACVTTIQAERAAARKQLAAATTMSADERKSENAKIAASYKARATECAQQFDLTKAEPSALPSLATLYRMAEMSAQTRAAYDRRIAIAPSVASRDSAYMAAISYYGDIFAGADRIATAEEYITRIDALGNDAHALKARAHAAMVNAYALTDTKYRWHSDRSLAAARAIPAAERRTSRAYLSGMTTGAETEAAEWRFDKAVAILKETLDGIGNDTTRVVQSLRRSVMGEMAVFAMVGKRAPEITARYWLNNGPRDSVRSVSFDKKVTLLEFTSTSCPWCKVGYPTIRKLEAKYRGQGGQVMLVGSVEGSDADSAVTVDKELEYDHRVWVEEDSITFPIAIVDTKDSVGADGKMTKAWPETFSAYSVSGFPGYFFVDGKGVIRYAQPGHVRDLEERFASVFDKLRKENEN